MDLFDAIARRRTTNGPFTDEPVSEEDQKTLMRVASAAPSQLNSQPWRFILIEDRSTIETIAAVSGGSMTEAMSNGSFFERYKRWFRFSRSEMDQKRDGMLFDRLPAILRPFTGQVFTPRGQSTMNRLRVPQRLGDENRRLVAGAPLLIAAMLDKSEARPGELSSFYSTFSLGAAMENVWLATGALGLGIQFVSFPMEVEGRWAEIETLLCVPGELELMAVYRVGHVPPKERRPAIDWSSRERRAPSQFVYRENARQPQTGWDQS